MPITDTRTTTNAPRRPITTAQMSAPPVRCELGSDTARCGDLTASSATGLCRLLLAAGTAPDAPLECFRNGTLALRVKSIRIGATLTVRETTTDGPRFVRWQAWPARAVKPPVRQNAPDGIAVRQIGAALDRIT
jgi:hypothetical protein